ncbi:hypothetical protein ACOSP7_026799 [Xanthoceras sorbifolium]
MSGSSTQRSRKNRGIEASASGCPGVTSSQRGALEAIVLSQFDNLDHPGEVELIPSLYGQPLTLYLLFRRNGLPRLVITLLSTGIDFDSFAEQPVQKGMFGSSVVVGSAAYSSSSLGLGVVVKEYFKRAPMLYKEFLTRGLSQCIEEDEDPDLCHTLVYQALLFPRRYFLSFVTFLGVDFVSWRAEELLMLISESLSVLRQAGRGSTLSVYIDLAS